MNMSPRVPDVVPTNIVVHRKPKRPGCTGILPEDYKTTKCDEDSIIPLKDNKSTMDEVVVYFEDYAATVTKGEMACLFQNHGTKAYLNDSVINAYIGLLKDQKHLMNRTDGSVILEETFVAEVLKSDAITTEENDDFYTLANSRTKKGMETMVARYLAADMVFIPINILETHWYLAVVNAKKGKIQILDSQGVNAGRGDLDKVLKGLQRRIDAVTKHIKIEEQRWQDHNVATWPRIEIQQLPMQKDDCSCGLFMLNYMEYWTGESLTDMFTQADMTQFRTKLTAILVTCHQNNVDQCPSVKKKSCAESDCPDDVLCLENASEEFDTPQSIICNAELHAREKIDDESINKRTKTCVGLDTVKCELYSDLARAAKNMNELLENTIMEDKPTTNIGIEGEDKSPGKRKRSPLVSSLDETCTDDELAFKEMIHEVGNLGQFLTQFEVDQWDDGDCAGDDEVKKEDDALKDPIKPPPPSRADYIQMLCDKLMMAEKPVHLETMWFLNSTKPQIKFSLKDLKNILIEETPMSTEFFKLGIMMISEKKCRKKSSALRNHYMDLIFNNMCPFWYPSDKHVLPDEMNLIDTFKSKSGRNVDASQCTSVFMPLHVGGQYSLIIFQLEHHKMFMFDPNPIIVWSQKVQFKPWAQKLDAIFQKYRFAMSKLSRKYVKDYWFWETTVMDEGWEERQRPASGYHVLSVIDGWNGEDGLAAKDVQTLRREFLVTVLASNLNEAREVLPDDVKSWLAQIIGEQE